MVPGKTYTLESYTELAWRRRWWLVLPFLFMLVAGFAVSQFLPDRYVSNASILIIPQRVPTNLVQNTVASALGERLNSISAQILGRTRLERIIDEFDLYATERADGELMEDVILQMRQDINVSIRQGSRRQPTDRFSVGFEATSPETAMQVAQRLASLFIQENLEERELQADATTRFLESQLAESRRGLVETEQRLQEYRQRYAGQLPSQLESNITVMQSAQTQRRSLMESTNRLIDRRIVLERLIVDAQNRIALLAVPGAIEDLPANASAAQQLEVAMARLRNIELRLRPEHPDVIGAKQIIRELERKAEAEALAQPLVPGSDPEAAAFRSPLEQQLAGYELELQTVERQIASHEEDQIALDQSIRDYQARIEATPSRESELTELTRDYTTLQLGYTALLQKSNQAKIGLNLERRQIGEQFRMVDAPRLPQRPVSPDRFRITLLSALAGLGLGAGLGFLLEYRDTSLRSMEDVVVSLSLPVLAVVPSMTSASERRQLQTVRWVAVTVAGIATIGLAAAAWRVGLLESLVARVL